MFDGWQNKAGHLCFKDSRHFGLDHFFSILSDKFLQRSCSTPYIKDREEFAFIS